MNQLISKAGTGDTGSYIIASILNSLANLPIRGCVTPKQIGNLSEGLEGDFDLLDGYDEISSENQEKIREAVEQGHVADSDWKGVSILISISRHIW